MSCCYKLKPPRQAGQTSHLVHCPADWCANKHCRAIAVRRTLGRALNQIVWSFNSAPCLEGMRLRLLGQQPSIIGVPGIVIREEEGE